MNNNIVNSNLYPLVLLCVPFNAHLHLSDAGGILYDCAMASSAPRSFHLVHGEE